MSFLNSQIAQEEEAQVKAYELVQARAERDLVNTRNQALEALLKTYASRIVELEIRLAMLEAEKAE